MRKRLIAVGLCAYATAHAAVVAAPAQDRPGFPTQARVWIENRKPDEAVPVAIVRHPGERPEPVEVIGVTMVALPPSAVVQTRSVPIRWEYRSIAIGSRQDMAAALQEPGRDGWEVTGIQIAASTGTTLLLKRPR